MGSGLHQAFGVSLGEGWLFNTVFWSFFCLLSVLLAFHVYLVFVVWTHLKEILAQVSRLPLARSFERMPARVARWFFETPKPRNRSVMIQVQATALAGRCSGVRSALERACSQDGVSQAEWDSLPAALERINEPLTHTTDQGRGGWRAVSAWLAPVPEFLRDPHGFLRLSRGEPIRASSESSNIAGRQQAPGTDARREEPKAVATGSEKTPMETGSMEPRPSEPTVAGANEILKRILARVWKGRPLTWTFAEGKAAEKVQEDAAAGWPILPETATDLVGAAGDSDNDILAGVREWTEMAEDLITLQMLRHLSQFLAQIWVMVGFIVVGSFTLLLAINSYPFPLQNRIGFFLAILIAVAALAILRLVLGINRDETISRVNNTMAGLKLDHNLVSGMIGYILPLIGILAAVSYDISDLLRVWLDPVFRILR